jgi:hypothetical protein
MGFVGLVRTVWFCCVSHGSSFSKVTGNGLDDIVKSREKY